MRIFRFLEICIAHCRGWWQVGCVESEKPDEQESYNEDFKGRQGDFLECVRAAMEDGLRQPDYGSGLGNAHRIGAQPNRESGEDRSSLTPNRPRKGAILTSKAKNT